MVTRSSKSSRGTLTKTGRRTRVNGPRDSNGFAVTTARSDIAAPWARFDPTWYSARYPDAVADKGGDPNTLLGFYLQQGQARGDSPNRYFDERFYRSRYPDVAAAVRDGYFPSGFGHYCEFGRGDRSPHWLFDDRTYRTRHPELTDDALASTGFVNRYHEYLARGAREDRIANIFLDPAIYRAQLPVEEVLAVTEKGAFHHLLDSLAVRRPEVASSPYFDPVWYRARYPAVAEAIAAGEWLSALHHYLGNDSPGEFDPLEHFSEAFYREQFPDIRAAIEAGRLRNGYEHFILFGAGELRAPVPHIDLRRYSAGNRELAWALQSGTCRDAFVHFLTHRSTRRTSLAPPPAIAAPTADENALASGGRPDRATRRAMQSLRIQQWRDQERIGRLEAELAKARTARQQADAHAGHLTDEVRDLGAAHARAEHEIARLAAELAETVARCAAAERRSAELLRRGCDDPDPIGRPDAMLVEARRYALQPRLKQPAADLAVAIDAIRRNLEVALPAAGDAAPDRELPGLPALAAATTRAIALIHELEAGSAQWRAGVDDLKEQLRHQRRQLEEIVGERDHALYRLADLQQQNAPERAQARERIAALRTALDELGRRLAVRPTSVQAGFASPAGPALAPVERYGLLFAEAARKTRSASDIIWLPVIDWDFRIQRPQHLAHRLAEAGARVFYISIVFEPVDATGRFRILASPRPGVFEVRLRLAIHPDASIYLGLPPEAVRDILCALDELVEVLGLASPVIVVDHPAWHEVASGIAGATVVYDCLDLATGFSDAAPSLDAAEQALLKSADLVATASRPLSEIVARQRANVIIRNAGDFDFFSQAFSNRAPGARPVIGYFGAIADWFAIEWIEAAATARLDWEFRLIGRTDGCDIGRAAKLANVKFLGEQPYRELPAHLQEFDVAIIPFKLVELTRCTNPVKLYEYMAAGKPVVAAPLPEVIEATSLAYVADSAASFTERIAQALREDSAELRGRRRDWAAQHNWQSRAGELAAAIERSYPPVSIVVLTYNNWEFTESCLHSLINWSDYPNLEIIVVDNASTDGTRQRLLDRQRSDNRLRVILNDTNLGFAAGNNVGLRAAGGDYVVLLNNDTYVTRGWVRDLIRPMELDPAIGMVGPLTDNIANAQQVNISFTGMHEMASAARSLVRNRSRQIFEVECLAFFCVALRRRLVAEVGDLDERYGLGFFEDDDYCMRVRAAGYRLAVAEDAFVHHHGSASFKKLGAKAEELITHNRKLFEQRWGAWQPHRRRARPRPPRSASPAVRTRARPKPADGPSNDD